MKSTTGKPTADKASEPSIMPGLLFLVALISFVGAIVFAFASATYLGPILAAALGIAMIVAGAVFSSRDDTGPGSSAAETAIALIGMFLILIGVVSAILHAFHFSF